MLADQLVPTGATNPEFIVGDDESPFVEAGIPVGGAENGDDEENTRKQARAWGGEAASATTAPTTRPGTNIDNFNRDVLGHYLRALAGALAHFATSTEQLR